MNKDSNIINGKIFAEEILKVLSAKISNVSSITGKIPKLAVIIVGDDPASTIYVRNKLKAAKEIGMEAFKVGLPNSVSQSDLLIEINKLNNNDEISGIIIQLPLPGHLEKNSIFSAVDPKKDVDGFHPVNVSLLHSGDYQDNFVPGTPLGIVALIKRVEPGLSGKNVIIIGRSNIVGKPLAALLLNEDCTVTICHSKTTNLAEFTRNADIIISAIGRPKFLNASYFSSKNIVIDVGISRDPILQKIAGDVDFEKVQPIVKYISPVPGGVGPMTIAYLLVNTFKAFLKANQLDYN